MTERVYRLLYKPRQIDRQIGSINAKIESLKYSLTISGIRYDKVSVKASVSDRMSEVAAEVDELERQRDALIAERIQSVREIEEAVNSLTDDTERTILYMQYVGKMEPKKIEKTISYSERGMYKIRTRALEHLNEII